jgi:hypothetical protein
VVRTVVILVLGAAAAAPNGAAQSFFKNQPPRLELSVVPPARPVALGTASALTLTVTPKPGIHVYAPGNPDYIPVAVDIVPQTGLSIEPAAFPPGKDLLFGPLKEAVKVYSEPFDVRVPFTPQAALRKAHPSGKTAVIMLKGTLSYQACNEKVCFPPQSSAFQAEIVVALAAAR